MGLKISKKKVGKAAAHIRSPKQEKAVAKRLGAERTPGSGCAFVRGDVRINKVVRIECKTTSHDSFRVTKDMIQKIEEAGLGSGELPAFVIEFLDSRGKPCAEVAVVPTWALDVFKSHAPQ